ncbi:MAG: putative hydro-lyase [Armatimonadota bacterium]|nr:putative hydro-lyase [Armatimonadota bacterium]MDR7402974.1 putative hydro-lyase [Armatimonadota bacterium]
MVETPSRAPKEWRERIRRGEWTRPTAGLAPGHAQANLVIVPRALAYDFLVFCQRNPKPCPLLEVTDPGDPRPRYTAQGADLRTDLPKYRIYERGTLTAEVTDLKRLWRDDLVAFLLGCSFTFEHAMRRAGIPVRHMEAGVNVPMYVTSIPCKVSGPFQGPMVVSMRPVPSHLLPRTVQVTSRYPLAHGGPVHIGAPEAIGIQDLGRPDFGDPVEVREGEVPVFWACGVTPQAVALRARIELLITHAPGHMFLTDLLDEDLALA